MIKVEHQELDKIHRITFTSNNLKADQDTMDLIGTLLLGQDPKRGSTTPQGANYIDIRKA